MRELSSIDVRHLVVELQRLVGSRIMRVYAPQDHALLIELRKPGEKLLVCITTPTVMHLTGEKGTMPDRPSAWCSLLRKYLEGSKVLVVEQPASERVIHIQSGKSAGTIDLFIELYGKGNIVLTDANGTIIGILHERAFKDRTLKREERYDVQPGPDVYALTETELASLLRTTDKSALHTFAAGAGIGTFYAKEVFVRAGVPPDATALNEKDIHALHRALREVLDAPVSPRVLEGGIPSPIVLESMSGGEHTATFSEALERCGERQAAPVVDDAFARQRTRLEKSIKAQEDGIAKLEQNAADAQRIGETLYERYVEIEAMLAAFRAARKQGADALEKLRAQHPSVKEYKPATNELVLDI